MITKKLGISFIARSGSSASYRALTLLLSVWISFLLPRQVVKPLVELREAVDHARVG